MDDHPVNYLFLTTNTLRFNLFWEYTFI